MKTNWKIDPTHSEIVFKVKHLVISTVTGNFRRFDGVLQTENDSQIEHGEVSMEIDVDSIDTNMSQRDEHLKSVDFFDAANHPKIQFKSSELNKINDEKYELKGDLEIRGNSQPVTLKVTYGGKVVDGYGQEKMGFEVEGEFSRKAFGLTWDAVTEAGSVVVSDNVKLLGSVQFVKS